MTALFALVFFLATGLLGLLLWLKGLETEQLGRELAQSQEELRLHLNDEGRFMDALWNRARRETARVEQARRQP